LNAPGAGMKPIRLLLVDDQPSVRRGLRMRFALELEVVGEAGDATEAISLAQTLRPDVVLMDVDMSGIDGILTIAMLRQVALHSTVVIFTLRDDAATQEQARAADAEAFVAKHRTEELLLAAIRGVAAEQQGRNDAR
jgi:two-component system, NarL family, nitrate/nitrite response regulator NarL